MAFSPKTGSATTSSSTATDPAGDTRVVEYEADGERVDPSSARELLRVDQPYPNHNGGLVLFGPDDLLFIGLGDGGSADDPDRNGLDETTLLGKILRIDPEPDGDLPYTVPDNAAVRRRGGSSGRDLPRSGCATHGASPSTPGPTTC
ncbi:MAG: PQQ-dependent sugar dehydrogenase [Solirubrobacterales bacterium]